STREVMMLRLLGLFVPYLLASTCDILYHTSPFLLSCEVAAIVVDDENGQSHATPIDVDDGVATDNGASPTSDVEQVASNTISISAGMWRMPNKFEPIPESLVALYIAQVLEGLVYLHEQRLMV
ncbi:hypothetical protein ACJX0J_010036, partial [Zea mays]